MENCIFCAIVQGKIPAHVVYQDDKFISFLDINPANPGHLVLAPKAHFQSIMEMGPEDYSQMFMIARALSLALLESGAEGINFLHSMGEAAGQRVPHLILHVIPRYKSDSIKLTWAPQQIDDSKLAELRDKIASFVKAPQQGMPVVQQPIQEQQIEEQPPKVYEIQPKTGGYW